MTVKNIESIRYCIYIDIDILPDNTIASRKILKYEMFVSNRQDFERKLLELFNVIHHLYRTMLGHFTIYNSYDNRNGKNPVLASYDTQNNKIMLMNNYQLDRLLYDYSKIYIVYR